MDRRAVEWMCCRGHQPGIDESERDESCCDVLDVREITDPGEGK